MTDFSLFIWGIVGLVLVILLTIFLLLVYSGLFTSFNIGAGKPPVQNLYVGYKFAQGPYKECGGLFTEAAACAPALRCFGIYYDKPDEVEPGKTRYAVGAILAEGEEKPNEKVEALMKERGFNFHSFPMVSSCVKTSFPYTTPLSIFIVVSRVYPAISNYIQEHRLCAHPCVEIYDKDTVHIMAPLARQDDFYVPEARDDDDDDVADDATTEYSSGSYGESSVERRDFPLFDEQVPKEQAPTVQTPDEQKPEASPGDKAVNDESPVEPSPQVKNGHDSGSEESTGTTSSFEQVNMDMEELKTPDTPKEEVAVVEGNLETEQEEEPKEEVTEKQPSSEP